MNKDLFFSVGLEEPDLLTDLEKIIVTHENGERLELDPHEHPIKITNEHTQVNGMEGDLGAICDVYRQTVYYYAVLKGILLRVGDQINLMYKDIPAPVSLSVLELEDSRARVSPPRYINRV